MGRQRGGAAVAGRSADLTRGYPVPRVCRWAEDPHRGDTMRDLIITQNITVDRGHRQRLVVVRPARRGRRLRRRQRSARGAGPRLGRVLVGRTLTGDARDCKGWGSACPARHPSRDARRSVLGSRARPIAAHSGQETLIRHHGAPRVQPLRLDRPLGSPGSRRSRTKSGSPPLRGRSILQR